MTQYSNFQKTFHITASVDDQPFTDSLPDWIYSVQGMEELLALAGSTLNNGVYGLLVAYYAVAITIE